MDASTLSAEEPIAIAGRTRALESVGHPVRLRIMRELSDAPASVPELADAVGAHENTVRAHLAALEEGGMLVSEARPVNGPGRPTVQYRLTAEGERMEDDFLGLAELLAVVLGRSGTTPEELHAIGREWGRYLVGRPGRYDPATRIPDVLRRLGYVAEVDGDRVTLSGCPCPVIAGDRPELICTLATGVLDGVLAASGAGRAVGAEEHDTVRRRCQFTLVDVTAKGG